MAPACPPLQLAPDCGVLALVGGDGGRLGRHLVGVRLLFVALECLDQVGHGARAKTAGEIDDQPDPCSRPTRRRHRRAGALQAFGPDAGVTPLVAGNALEGSGARLVLLDRSQRLVQDDRVALELEVFEAALDLVGRQLQRCLGHRA